MTNGKKSGDGNAANSMHNTTGKRSAFSLAFLNLVLATGDKTKLFNAQVLCTNVAQVTDFSKDTSSHETLL